MSAGCYSDDGRDLYPPYPFDYLTHGEAIAKRDEFNARDERRGQRGDWDIIRASIFYRVMRGTSAHMRVPDPVGAAQDGGQADG